ncbi:DUF1801 domain-containing protein [Cellulomonas sp. DKR-3]|uniref:DUF1801 domain-containing protein n=1 Tax=Cellulomonas fulva TaxID=2835530 RepID=A0ABS5TUK5_9CELL|nr:DUF1801 domain-containing protein [Cellulomonas fulva]MBT0992817.1 DUF1801 domain-containing protein [Cellulomonas fulva]
MATNDENDGFTAEERAAMKERAKETRATKGKVDPEAEVLAKIAELPDDDRAIAERIHALVAEHAPAFAPRTWYGMPAYAKDGKVAVFFQPASKFKARYATLGFNDSAALDDGSMWPTSFAITTLTPADEKRIGELIARAAG